MRGKKSNPEFISQFIQIAVRAGHETPEAIVKFAKEQIEKIDDEIRAAESKKITRSSLLDVVASFEAPNKDKTEEAKLLPFFEISHQDRCKVICDMLKKVNSLPVHSEVGTEHNFCIKQLIGANIINRTGDILVQGERFDEYMKFVLREVE
jgi:hypothetical protein